MLIKKKENSAMHPDMHIRATLYIIKKNHFVCSCCQTISMHLNLKGLNCQVDCLLCSYLHKYSIHENVRLRLNTERALIQVLMI